MLVLRILSTWQYIWQPTQRLQWLGFVVDLAKHQTEVPMASWQDSYACSVPLLKPLMPAKLLASIVGKTISRALQLAQKLMYDQ